MVGERRRVFQPGDGGFVENNARLVASMAERTFAGLRNRCGAGIFQKESRLAVGKLRRDRDRHQPGRDRAEEKKGVVAAVGEAEEQPVARNEAGGEQPARDPADRAVEFGIGPPLGPLDPGGNVADHDQRHLAGVGIGRSGETMPREIEARWNAAVARPDAHPPAGAGFSQSAMCTIPCTVQPPSTTSVWPVM